MNKRVFELRELLVQTRVISALVEAQYVLKLGDEKGRSDALRSDVYKPSNNDFKVEAFASYILKKGNNGYG